MPLNDITNSVRWAYKIPEPPKAVLIQEPLEPYLAKYTADATDMRAIMKIAGMPNGYGPWIAAGAIRKLILNEPIGDGDIDILVSGGSQFMVVESFFALEFGKSTQSNRSRFFPKTMPQISINNSYFGPLDESLATYDITVCQFATDSVTLFYTKEAMEDLHSKTLRLVANSFVSDGRIMKYFLKGYLPIDVKLTQLIDQQLQSAIGVGLGDNPDFSTKEFYKNTINYLLQKDISSS